MYRLVYLLCLAVHTALTLDTSDIVVIILSQPNQYNLQLAESLKKNIFSQVDTSSKHYPLVYISCVHFSHVGDWTVIPLIPELASVHRSDKLWFLFIQDFTHIELDKLIAVLDKYDHNEEIWLGHAIHDRAGTIIHHFAFHDDPSSFLYPCMPSGIALSNKLMQVLSLRLKTVRFPPTDFNIDSAHELALFIWDRGRGNPLTHEQAFCIKEEPHCATYPLSFKGCGGVVNQESVYFAVKTCKKFHLDRLPIIKKTWGSYVKNLNFFSDTKDEHIPTIDLGIPNVEQGHCDKTVAIIKYISQTIRNLSHIKWAIIVDDDTVLSVSRLLHLLACYNLSHSVALGERYGFNVYNNHGYNYITGGGGIVLSRVLLEELSKDGVCKCPSLDSPDDMYIGICIANLGVSVIHSPQFHQARPSDYPPELLEIVPPVSFHKHWMVDPKDVYDTWFAQDDANMKLMQRKHEEL